MIKAYAALIDLIKSQQPLMVEQLHHWCEINSGSTNLPGLANMAQMLQQAYEPIADEIHLKDLKEQLLMNKQGNLVQQQFGKALLIRKRPHLKRRILVSGHMDTVYPAESPFQKLTYTNKDQINGPGVADMKGGLIVILHALSAFENSPYSKNLGWDLVINSDEELGSPASKFLFDELAPQYSVALVYEPAMTPQGTLAKNRRGSGKLTLIAQGKAAHVGRAFEEGKNAICYLAEIIPFLHALNGQKEGVTVNIGSITGGEALNMVPAQSVLQMDVRIKIPEDELWVLNKIEQILNQFKRPYYSLSLHSHFLRPVKKINKPTELLFERIKSLGTHLGLSLDWKDSGGCCDGNNLAQHGLAVLDTLGVRGGNIHSPEEFIILDSLPERAALSALLMMDLAQGSLEEIRDDASTQCSGI